MKTLNDSSDQEIITKIFEFISHSKKPNVHVLVILTIQILSEVASELSVEYTFYSITRSVQLKFIVFEHVNIIQLESFRNLEYKLHTEHALSRYSTSDFTELSI
jgi:hypothetical protein